MVIYPTIYFKVLEKGLAFENEGDAPNKNEPLPQRDRGGRSPISKTAFDRIWREGIDSNEDLGARR